MKYASTQIVAGNEIVITTLPLSLVPQFNPANQHPFTYGVADEVQAGWIKQADGSFIAPTPSSIPSSVSAGSGAAHNNVQPTFIANYIIKT